MATSTAAPAFDPAKLDAFMGKAVMDLGAAMHAALIVIGDKLGLFRAMAGAGPMTSAEVAAKTKTSERYVREWLNANAASGYITYDGNSMGTGSCGPAGGGDSCGSTGSNGLLVGLFK